MAKTCQVTGARPHFGNHVSHANNKRKRVFRPNLQTKRFHVPSLNADVVLTVSARAIRTIQKRGIDVIIRELQADGVKLRLTPRTPAR